MLKIFITGITSEVGAALAREFRSTGHEVWGLSRRKSLEDYMITGDLCEITERSLPAEIVFDILIHAASYVPIDELNSHWSDCYNSNLNGTENLLKVFSARVKKIILISSCAVYGQHQGRTITESVEPLPITAYALSKLGQEIICSSFCGINKIPLIILRLGYVYGKDTKKERVVMQFIIKILRNKKITLINKNETILNLINVSDIGRLVAYHHQTLSGIYNVVSTERVSLNDFIGIAESFLKQNADLVCVQNSEKPCSDRYVSLRLPFSEPKEYTTLKDGIKLIVEGIQ